MLTTHYMDEAQALADRVAVISAGQIVAEGTATAIGGRDTARTRIRFTLPAGYADADLAQGLPGTAGQGIRLSSRARATASVRLAAPSLPRTWLTCFLTVSRVTTSSRAMA